MTFIVVRVIDDAVISAGVLGQIAQFVVAITVGAAVGVNVANDVLRGVTEEPFGTAVRMADAVRVTQAIVVMPGFVAQSVSDVGQADVFIPCQSRVKTAVVGPFANSLGVGTCSLPLQIQTTIGAVGVAGNQVVLILVAPGSAVLVLGHNKVTKIIVLISAQLPFDVAVTNFPKPRQPSLIINQRADSQVDFTGVLFPISHQFREHRMPIMPMLVMQHHPGTIGQHLVDQNKTQTPPDVGFPVLQAAHQH